ncbi:MAG: RNA-directed DNA polymerase [Bacilli bacterium]|nr:RNA-directed DNA polymerase [Bacilli bacterium]
MAKKLIYMTNTSAKKYFLTSENYFNLEMPPYFNFQPILDWSDNCLNIKTSLSSLYNRDKTKTPEKLDDVNYKFECNKDGKYAWRPFQIIHPLMYVDLVNTITESKNWIFIKKRFKEFKSNQKHIICCSDLIESKSKTKNKSAMIIKWWSEFEQQSINSALDYKHITRTDITDCYGSIYTHSIAWALHGKEEVKKKMYTDNSFKNWIGNKIDKSIQKMQHNQTNGIPQGSNLMDFIAEIVLGYADLLLYNELKELGVEDYKILRYRDDYRIFTNNSQIAEQILGILTRTLLELSLKLNSSKTFLSEDVITDSIKEDKIYWMQRKNDIIDLNLQEKILIIRELSKKYPNSGSLIKALTLLYKNDFGKLNKIPNNSMQIISIVVDIMYSNPRSYPICSAILSKVLEKKGNINDIIQRVSNKMATISNTDYFEVWFQRMCIPKKVLFIDCWKSKLFEKVNNPRGINIWNSDWLNIVFDESSIIDIDIIDNLPTVILEDEFDIFNNYAD